MGNGLRFRHKRRGEIVELIAKGFLDIKDKAAKDGDGIVAFVSDGTPLFFLADDFYDRYEPVKQGELSNG